MFCKKCGTQLPDGTAFCTNCGEKLAETPVSQPAVTETPAAPQVPFMAKLKKFVSSPLVLAAVVLMTLAVIMNITAVSNILDNFIDVIEDIADVRNLDDELEYEFEREFDMDFEVVENFFTGIGIVSQLPAIVILAGLWITIISAFDKNGSKMTTSGMTAVKIINIINIVGVALWTVLGTILYLIIISNDFIGAMLIPVILGWVVAAFYFIFYGKILKSIDNFTKGIKTNAPAGTASKLVAILIFIAGAISVISAIVTGAGLAAWCTNIANILFGVIIFKFNALVEG